MDLDWSSNARRDQAFQSAGVLPSPCVGISRTGFILHAEPLGLRRWPGKQQFLYEVVDPLPGYQQGRSNSGALCTSQGVEGVSV